MSRSVSTRRMRPMNSDPFGTANVPALTVRSTVAATASPAAAVAARIGSSSATSKTMPPGSSAGSGGSRECARPRGVRQIQCWNPRCIAGIPRTRYDCWSRSNSAGAPPSASSWREKGTRRRRPGCSCTPAASSRRTCRDPRESGCAGSRLPLRVPSPARSPVPPRTTRRNRRWRCDCPSATHTRWRSAVWSTGTGSSHARPDLFFTGRHLRAVAAEHGA